MQKKLLFLFCFLFFTNIANADSVLITGANRGIGLALTELYLKEGYKVFATYLSKQKSTQLLAIKNPNLVTIQVDLASNE